MIDVALFGAGRTGTIHASNVAREEGVRLKYVVDVNQDAAQKLAARHGAQTAAVAQGCAAPDARAVRICSAAATHAVLILAAAAACKQIFCEKPVDLAI